MDEVMQFDQAKTFIVSLTETEMRFELRA